MKLSLKPLLWATTLMLSSQALAANPIPNNLTELSTYAKVSQESLALAIQDAVYQQKIIDSITKPSEGKPWWQYRKIFITVSRIEAALKFYFARSKRIWRTL